MSKVNKWQVIAGKLVKVEKEGKPASDLVIEMIDETYDEMEQPIVEALSAKDKTYSDARQKNMASSIDRKRINNAIVQLNQDKQEFINYMLEAAFSVEQAQQALVSNSAPIFEASVIPFNEMLERALKGEMVVASVPESEPKGRFDDLI